MRLHLRNRLLVIALGALCGAVPMRAQNSTEIKPSPQQVEWQDLEFGVIIHFSTNTFLDREWGDGTASPSVFDPTQFDPDQWMKAIRDRGRKVCHPRRQASRRLLPLADRADGLQRESQSVEERQGRRGGRRGARCSQVRTEIRRLSFALGSPRPESTRTRPPTTTTTTPSSKSWRQITAIWSSSGSTAPAARGHVYNFKQIIETLRTYQPNTDRLCRYRALRIRRRTLGRK